MGLLTRWPDWKSHRYVDCMLYLHVCMHVRLLVYGSPDTMTRLKKPPVRWLYVIFACVYACKIAGVWVSLYDDATGVCSDVYKHTCIHTNIHAYMQRDDMRWTDVWARRHTTNTVHTCTHAYIYSRTYTHTYIYRLTVVTSMCAGKKCSMSHTCMHT